MTLDADAAYLALAARDARFDGRLFVGVTSTGIYCRPICRVRTPKRENCRFFDTPAQAEAAEFRPCLKCRPEIAPGAGLAWTVMDASRTLAQQAGLWLDAQAASGDAPAIAALADRLGVSDRHLRRIFATEHGVTPMQYLQTRRLLLAKQLLTDTQLPVSQVALASGFRSLRRFNAAFGESYRMSPGRLRGEYRAGAKPVGTPDTAVAVTLAYRAPYDMGRLLRFMAQRAIPGIEDVVLDGSGPQGIRRTLRAGCLGGATASADGWVEAWFAPGAPLVKVRFSPSLAPASASVVASVRRWLDLDARPDAVDTALATLPGGPGLRLPGSMDAFELAVRAVLGQQVTVAAARTLAHRLVERFGMPMTTPWSDTARTFPSPQVLAAAAMPHIAEQGIIRTRSAAIQALACVWPEIETLLREQPAPEVLVERLCRLPGIGPWTAHYVAMRTLGWPDAFPPNDVALLKAMQRHFSTTSQREADMHAASWRPWRSYAVLRLWNSLEATP
jgi:AraC family transcriptional regulator of adaptative response / DNA-3-methyladenine glycosylase II